MNLTAVTIVMDWVIAVVAVEILLLSEDNITGGADEAGGGVDPVEVGLAVFHISDDERWYQSLGYEETCRSGEGVNLDRAAPGKTRDGQAPRCG